MSKKKPESAEVVIEAPEIPGHNEVARVCVGEKQCGMAMALHQRVQVAVRAEEHLKRELAQTFQERQEAENLLSMYLGSVTELAPEVLVEGRWVLWTHDDQVFVSEIERVKDSE